MLAEEDLGHAADAQPLEQPVLAEDEALALAEQELLRLEARQRRFADEGVGELGRLRGLLFGCAQPALLLSVEPGRPLRAAVITSVLQVCVGQVCVSHVRPLQPRPLQLRPHKDCPLQVRVVEECPQQLDPVKVRPL